MKKSISIAIVAALTNAACDQNIFTSPPPAHALAASDNSLSIKPDCAGLAGAVRGVTKGSDFIEGSSVSLLVIGRSVQKPGAALAFDKKLPTPADTVMGRNDDEVEKAQAALFAGLESACASAPPSKSSPILRLLQDGVAHLHAKGCGPKSRCYLELQSDLREEVDQPLRAAIARLSRDPRAGLPPSLISAIDNAGIDVRICGGSAQAVSGDPQAPEGALQRLWLKSFTHPEAVSFRPFCGE